MYVISLAVKIFSISGLLIVLGSVFALAQKLPKIQEVSFWAPENIKIDGRDDEWRDGFKAYNTANFIYYTISNNDVYVYLTVHMTGEFGNRKILRGGLTFTISQTQKSTTKAAIRYNAYIFRGISRAALERGELTETESLSYSPHTYTDLITDTVANKGKIDELIALSNRQIKNLYKEIQVTGIKEITDPMISVYNPEGIRAAAMLSNKMEYVYELAIPRKLLGGVLTNTEKFVYNIKIHPIAIQAKGVPPPPIVAKRPGGGDPRFEFLNSTTDFSGEYTLAKKK